MIIRPYTPADLAALHVINQAGVPGVGDETPETLGKWLKLKAFEDFLYFLLIFCGWLSLMIRVTTKHQQLMHAQSSLYMVVLSEHRDRLGKCARLTTDNITFLIIYSEAHLPRL